MSFRTTVYIPDVLRAEMEKIDDVNWSAIACEAFTQYIQQHHNPSFHPPSSRLQKLEARVEDLEAQLRDIEHRLKHPKTTIG